MGSRGKKKLQNSGKSVLSADAVKLDSLSKENAKWNSIFNISFTILVLIMFVFLVTLPIVNATFSIEVEDVELTETTKTFSISLLDIGMAPVRGIHDGFTFVLDQFGAKNRESDLWDSIMKAVVNYVGEDIVQTCNDAGIFAYTLDVIIYALFVVMVVGVIVERATKKDEYLFTTISISLFDASILVLFISTIAAAVNAGSSAVKINIGVGVFLIGLIAAMLLALNIVYVVKYRKAKKEYLEFLKVVNNESM